MPTENFRLSVKEVEGSKVINFVNNLDQFVEVIFTIDGKEVKNGLDYSPNLKGYAYPPKISKDVKRMLDDSPLKFRLIRSGEVSAYIFRGKGSYYDKDIDKPAFLRHKLVKSIKFNRTDKEPFEILTIKY